MTSHPSRQRGISLFVVLVMVLLTALLVIWASRTSLFNELITGNDADYQRALEAAQAMVRDAEFDIKGIKPDGSACRSDLPAGCRSLDPITATHTRFPQPGSNEDDYADLVGALSSKTPSCAQGICISDHVMSEFWKDPDALAEMRNVGAKYGSYTQSVPIPTPPSTNSNASANVLLIPTKNKAWYWVEVLPFVTSLSGNPDSSTSNGAASVSALIPDPSMPYVYRITAVAQGNKAGTQAVVQSIFVWKKPAV